MKIKIVDNSQKVLDIIAANTKVTLNAMGIEAVGLIVDQMQSGYGKPIRQTGDLMRDVSYEVERSGNNTVDIGNSLEYAIYVHEGTYKMRGRPYIKDAILSGEEQLKAIAEEKLKAGF